MKENKGITVGQLRECLAEVDADAKVRLNGFTSEGDIVDIKRYDVGGEDVIFLKSAEADAPYGEDGKRIVYYDYKLLTSIAYITRNWDDDGKQRYLAYMKQYLSEYGFYELLDAVGEQEPITLRLDELDPKSLRLTMEFLIRNERGLADHFRQFSVDDGK